MGFLFDPDKMYRKQSRFRGSDKDYNRVVEREDQRFARIIREKIAQAAEVNAERAGLVTVRVWCSVGRSFVGVEPIPDSIRFRGTTPSGRKGTFTPAEAQSVRVVYTDNIDRIYSPI